MEYFSLDFIKQKMSDAAVKKEEAATDWRKWNNMLKKHVREEIRTGEK